MNKTKDNAWNTPYGVKLARGVPMKGQTATAKYNAERFKSSDGECKEHFAYTGGRLQSLTLTPPDDGYDWRVNGRVVRGLDVYLRHGDLLTQERSSLLKRIWGKIRG